MTLITILALAVALAMDAFAVAVATGIQLRCVTASQTLRMAGVFGLFQFAMPVAGWLAGVRVQRYIESWDHWIAFILLTFIGARMLKEVWDKRDEDRSAECDVCPTDPTTGKPVILLGIATSIDALAVGLSMALLGQDVWFPAIIIGVVCFVFTAAGIHIGRIVCHLAGNWGDRANVLGGFVLIAIGINILYEHGVFA